MKHMPLFENDLRDACTVMGEDAPVARKALYADMKASLSSMPLFSDMDDADWSDLYGFFESRGALSVLLADGVFFKFAMIASNMGFPMTMDAAKASGIATNRFDSESIINGLVGADVLSVVEMPASEALKKSKRIDKEDKDFKAHPEKPVLVYEYADDFIKELGIVAKKLKFKREGMDILEHSTLRIEAIMKERTSSQILEECDSRLEKIMSLVEAKKKDKEKEDEDDSEDEGKGKKTDEELEAKFAKKITDDMIEGFVDSLLLNIAELEQTGQIDPIESPDEIQSAVLAVVRKLNQKRGVITSLSRKFARFGSRRALTRARLDISKALK